LAKAKEKNGSSNVNPAPVRVGACPPGPTLVAATAGAEVVVPAELQGGDGQQDGHRGRGLGGWMSWAAARMVP